MIVLKNGKNIYPEEIEGYIQSLDYVTEVIVKGIRNEYQEETALLAEVFLSAEKTEKEVIKDINALIKDLPSYKHISSVLIRKEEFPKTTSKKIRRMPA
jgi:long-chain acyl-CoA synthetase